MTALPPLLVVLLFIRNLFLTCCKPYHAATRTTGPALVIVYAVFPISAATIFNTFMTESFDDGNKRLTYDLSFDVTDPRYDIMFKYALTMVRLPSRPSIEYTRNPYPRFDSKANLFESQTQCKAQQGFSETVAFDAKLCQSGIRVSDWRTFPVRDHTFCEPAGFER